jgi:hypothetical protein
MIIQGLDADTVTTWEELRRKARAAKYVIAVTGGESARSHRAQSRLESVPSPGVIPE